MFLALKSFFFLLKAMSSYKVFVFCICKMRLVVLIILLPGRASNSATVSSYEGYKFCIYLSQEARRVAAAAFYLIMGDGEIHLSPARPSHVAHSFGRAFPCSAALSCEGHIDF